MKKLAYILIFYTLFSCGSENSSLMKHNSISSLENRLLITVDGDSLEDGFWKYNNEVNKISKNGFYKKGYKVKEWNYKSPNDSTSLTWEIFNKGRVKFNYPKYLKISDSIEYPVLFQGDIVDGDNNTYVALLEYKLNRLDATILDYLYQANQSIEKGSVEILKSRESKKIYFKNAEIYKYNVKIQHEKNIYEAISYIFEANGNLYDITLVNIADRMTSIDYEVFSDILYSMECNGLDLFTYHTKQYYKEEDLIFE